MLWNQELNWLCVLTVNVLVCKVDPEAGLNVKVAWVIARVGSNPITVTESPVEVVLKLALEIVGAEGPIVIVRDGAGEGVMSVPLATNVAVMVITPATVPVWTETLLSDVVAPAGTVTLVVRDPLENITFGSSGPFAGANVNVRFTVTGTG